jgi:sugar phosphate isomerase/epimerase
MFAFATDYNGENRNTADIKENLAKLARAGFTHVHWGHEWDGPYSYSVYEMLQIREWLDELGLKAKGVHASDGARRSRVKTMYHYAWRQENIRDYTSENEYNRLAGVELIKNRVDLAHALDAENIVLHMQLPYKSFQEDPSFQDRYYTQACKSFDELVYYCKARNIRICIENLPGAPPEYQRRQFDFLFGRYDRDFLGFCFDTGHANIICSDNLEFARRYQDRIYMVHMADNHGLSSEECWEDGPGMSACDEHLLPFEGSFDWEGFAPILAASPYKPPYLLEAQYKGGDETAYLKRAIQAGERFAALILR